MCRNIKTLANFAPPATDEEIRASALQFVRKLSGATKPSKANEAVFHAAVEEVTAAAHKLVHSLRTSAPPRTREEEAQKAKARSQARFGTVASLLMAIAVGVGGTAAAQTPRAPEPVAALKVTVLSTMLAGNPGEGVGEWGFAAIVEADGQRWLVDTGARADTVLGNAAELGIDLSTITDLVITHNHADHTGGLLVLRRELAKRNPRALSRAHVGRGIFLSRTAANGRETNGLLPLRAEYESLGGTFVEHDGPVRLGRGVWFTGPVPRVHPERNWSGASRLQGPDGPGEDTIPEDASIVVETADGLVLISGCGHAGMINTIEHARATIRQAPVHTAIGGFHLFAASDDHLTWTGGKLREFGLRHLLGAHCTGIEATFHIRQAAGLTRQTAIVGAVGASYTLGKGLDARQLAR